MCSLHWFAAKVCGFDSEMWNDENITMTVKNNGSVPKTTIHILFILYSLPNCMSIGCYSTRKNRLYIPSHINIPLANNLPIFTRYGTYASIFLFVVACLCNY